MLLRPPKRLSPEVERLCNRLVPGVKPVYLRNNPRSDGMPNECYGTVALQVAEAGGTTQHGWAIWEWPATLLEGEFHAVWKAPDGTLVDVTPRVDGQLQVLFLPDPVRSFQGTAIDNVRVALRDDPRIDEFIKLAERRYEVLNRGDRAHQFGLVSVSREEIAPIMLRMLDLQYELAEWVPSRNDPCHCGSGKKFKRCHGAAPR